MGRSQLTTPDPPGLLLRLPLIALEFGIIRRGVAGTAAVTDFHHRLNLHLQSKKGDKALCVSLIINIFLAESGEILAVEAVGL